jgi:hypothetical protein
MPVKALELARAGRARFFQPRQESSTWVLPVVAPELTKPGVVTALLRVRKGVSAPPSAAAPAVVTRMRVDQRGNWSSGRERRFGAFTVDNEGYFLGGPPVDPPPRTVYFQVFVFGNVPFGKIVRFGFSIELRHDGQVIGGMRSGAACRRVQLPGHSVMRCTAPGFARHP